LSRQQRNEEAGEIVRRLDGPFARLDAHFSQLAYLNGLSATASLARLAAIRRRLFFMLLGIGIGTLAGTLLIGGWATRRVALREAETELETRILEDRNRNLDAFAGHVAHDLRNEVAVISYASAQLTAKLPSGEPAVEQLRRGVQGMNELVGDLLTLARADAPLQGPCDPARVAGEIEDRLAPGIREAGGTLSVAVEPAELWCSHGLLRRALANLAENAVKYSRPGVPPEVDITGGPVVGEGAYILRVRDNGLGVGAEDRARIFEPFYRAQRATEVPGTGLGLAIVKRVIESSGGRLWVEPNPDVGATFVVYLPLVDIGFARRREPEEAPRSLLESGAG
jgi:signal transduction histidine kinase